MPTAIDPYNSMPSCRNEPGSHGTWKAIPASVPQPTVVLDTASGHRCPASPRRYGGCAPDSRVRQQPGGPKDNFTPCPSTGVEVPPRWAEVVRPQWRRASPPTTWHHEHWLPPPQCSKAHPVRPPQGDSAYCLPCHDLSDYVQLGPPKTSFTHASVCGLPFPLHVAQLSVLLNQHCPHTAPSSTAFPKCGGWCCRPQVL